MTALLNRRVAEAAETTVATTTEALRSRGLLCLDAAAAGPALDAPAAIDPATGDPYPARLDAALRVIGRDRYAPCSLVGLEAGGPSWVIALHPGGDPRASILGPGWHVITHGEMDDLDEPRTRALLARLQREHPETTEGGLDLLMELLITHGDSGSPPVCLHRERFPTVSSTLLSLGLPGRSLYSHAGGPPCITPYEDHSALL